MITQAHLAHRMAAFTLSVCITVMAGAGLASQTYSPAAMETRTTLSAPDIGAYSGAHALPTLAFIDQTPKTLVI